MASWAAYAKVSAKVVCRAASWSANNMFNRHYRVDLTPPSSQAFGSAVIAAVVAHKILFSSSYGVLFIPSPYYSIACYIPL